MSAHLNLQKNLQKATIRLTLQLHSLSEMARTLHLKTTGNLTKNPAMNVILLFYKHLNKIVALLTHDSGRLVYIMTSFGFCTRQQLSYSG